MVLNQKIQLTNFQDFHYWAYRRTQKDKP